MAITEPWMAGLTGPSGLAVGAFCPDGATCPKCLGIGHLASARALHLVEWSAASLVNTGA